MNESLSPEERALIRGRQRGPHELVSLIGWYPVVAGANGLWWTYLGDKRFSEPFFHDTLATISLSDRLCLHTGYDALAGLDAPPAPTAFIFHTSRCGSTLLTQLLTSLPECIALSEPPVIDSFLRRYYAGQHGDKAVQRLRSLITSLGQRRFAHESHLIIKLDSWHIASLPLFRLAFPDTPMLFLYREPAEIIDSHRRQRGRQMVPGMVTAAMPPLDFTLPEPGDLDSYCVKILESFFDAACRHSDELLFINYRQLPGLVWEALLDFLGIDSSVDRLTMMKSRARLHSKNSERFIGDPKLVPANACPTSLQIRYDRLERLRERQSSYRCLEARIASDIE